jgi:hypothetical protein
MAASAVTTSAGVPFNASNANAKFSPAAFYAYRLTDGRLPFYCRPFFGAARITSFRHPPTVDLATEFRFYRRRGNRHRQFTFGNEISASSTTERSIAFSSHNIARPVVSGSADPSPVE